MTRRISLTALLEVMKDAFEQRFTCTFDLWTREEEEDPDSPEPLFDVFFGHPDEKGTLLTLRVLDNDTFILVGDIDINEENLLIFSNVLRNAHDLMSLLEVMPDEEEKEEEEEGREYA